MSMQSITTWTFKPHEPLDFARRFADLEGTALLLSGGNLDPSHASFLCLFPDEKITIEAHTTCWEELEKKLGLFDAPLSIPRWVGYLGYEMGCFADQDKIVPYLQPSIPDTCFYRPTVVIHFDHHTKLATLYTTQGASLDRSPPPVEKESSYSLVFSSDTLESYVEKIAQIKEWIASGEIYQVNLSQEFHLEGKGAPFSHFERIIRLNPAPFSAFLNCGTFSVVSSSPERFLSKQGTRLETRPIKGTKPRGKTPQEDACNREMLFNSEKERAELLMITDLARHDLGKVSAPNSVKTHTIWHCEAYTNVFHLLSIIEGRCHADAPPVQLIRQLFPGGSITGCPKLRAMEAIIEFEKRPRGLYTGSLGYFAENGDFDFNIAIRTLIVHSNHIQIQLGGAIVIDSDPMKEYEETLHKGHSLFNVLKMEQFLL